MKDSKPTNPYQSNGFFKPVTDISSSMPEIVRNSNSFLLRVIESLDDYAIFTSDINGNVNSWNKGAERLLQYKEEEIKGKNVAIFYTDEDSKNHVPEQEMNKALQQGSTADVRYHKRKDGSTFWCNGMMYPLFDEHQQQVGYTNIMRNLTEVRKAEVVLEGLNDYLNAIISTAREPFLVLSKELVVKSANAAFYKAFKVSKQETENVLVYDLGNGQWNIPELRDLLNHILPDNGVIENYEVKHTFEQIGAREMLFNAKRLSCEFHDYELILLAIEDITVRKELELQKDEFIALASHELKSPLTGIKAYSEFIVKEMESSADSPVYKPVVKMNNLVSRLNRMVDYLLDISKIQNTGLTLKKKVINLHEVIIEHVNDLQEHNEKRHNITLQAEGEYYVNVDAFAIGQVMKNLLSNSIKYSPANTPIEIRIEQNEAVTTVSITDYGIGIPAGEQPKLFQRFSRASNALAKHVLGIGLGLYLTKEIIKAHKGEIWVRSKENEETTFFFTLPSEAETATPE